MKYFIGIDPGLTGAIVLLNAEGQLMELSDLPTMVAPKAGSFVKRSINPILLELQLSIHFSRPNARKETIVCIEKVSSRPGQGIASAFSLGHTAGIIEGILRPFHPKIEFVTPKKWKNYYGLGKEKAHSLEKAREIFPDAKDVLDKKKHHNRAEALLLANYAKHVFGG